MEEYLRDSPSEFGNSNRNSNTNMDLNNAPFNPDNYATDLDSFSMPMNSGLGIPQNTYSSGSTYGQGMAENNFLSPTASAFNTDAQNYASSVKSDPFLEDLESLNFPHNQANTLQNQFIDPQQSTTTNLDEIISPGHNNGFDTGTLNSQYFSPPTTRNYNGLNAIAEDGLSNSFNNAFSPNNLSRHGSISVAVPPSNNFPSSFNEPNVGSYLSPPTNSQFMSPSHTNNYDSLDTLRSPSFNSASYLNSPPQYQNIRIPSSNSHSTSIPNNISSNILSPPNTSHLGMSAPSSSEVLSNASSGNVGGSSMSTKQLSKEEKLKRRREFHNAVERRRRDLIKERIKDLGLLVPPSLLNPQLSAVQTLQKSLHLNSREINDLLASLKVKETKPNKSTILNKSVDYIFHLKYVLEEQDRVQASLTKQIQALEAKLSVSGGETYDFQDLGNLTLGPQSHDALQNALGLDSVFNPDDFFADVGGDPGVKPDFSNY